MLHASDFSFTAPEIPKDLEVTLDPGLVRVSWHAVDDADSSYSHKSKDLVRRDSVLLTFILPV